MAGFGLNKTKQTKTTPSKEDIAAARFLYDTLKSAKLVLVKFHTNKWANQIRLIRLNTGGSSEKVMRTLEWWSQNKDDPYTPQIFDPLMFRRKYENIQNAMLRAGCTMPLSEISPAAIQLSRRLGFLWPKEPGVMGDFDPAIKEQELTFIQTTMNNHAKWRAALIEARNKHKPGKEYNLLAGILLELSSADHWTEQRLEEVHIAASRGWYPWRGNLVTLAWHPAIKHFRQMLEDWVDRHCGPALTADWVYNQTGVLCPSATPVAPSATLTTE